MDIFVKQQKIGQILDWQKVKFSQTIGNIYVFN